MRLSRHRFGFSLILLFFPALLSVPVIGQDGAFEPGPLSQDRLRQAAEAAGFRVRSVALDLPLAQRPRLLFSTFDYDDPLLVGLRQKYPLEKLVAGAPDEWTAQLRLKDWVFRRIPGGNPQSSPKNSLEILERASQGEEFYCTYYAITYVECAHALGWQARKLGVDRKHGGGRVLGSTHHGVAEVWSNQYRKWVVMDSQSNLHFEKKGVPLAGWEIRAEWLRNKGTEVDHVVGAPPHSFTKNPAMVWEVPDVDEIATYHWLYVQDSASVASPSSRYILLQDQHNSGEIWYQNDRSLGRSQFHNAYLTNRFEPTNRIEDVYWTVGVVEASLAGTASGSIRFELDTYCPNLAGYETSRDGRTWESADSAFSWHLQPGWNSLGLRTVNRGGITGPEVSLMILLEPESLSP